jgi:protease I
MDMERPLAGKSVAILVGSGFEESQMTETQRALLAAGATPKVVSMDQGLVNGWHGNGWGHYFAVDQQISTALAADFDAALIPGGERSVAKLAGNPHTRRMLRSFMDGFKPIAMLGAAPQLLALAERAKGRKVTAEESAHEALREAEAVIVDEALVIDGNLLTARDSVDIEAFKAAFIEHILAAEAAASQQAA